MNETPGPGAAAVAAQLLEFYREPARYRPAWIHGEARLPEGHVVLKFALGRFSPGWQRDLSKHDKEALVEAAQAFVRQVCLWERSTHYHVLCLNPEAPAEAVRENYRLLMALLHPDRQEDATTPAWPTGCAQRVNESYAVLSGVQQRAEYDMAISHAHPVHEFDMETAAPIAMRTSRRRHRPAYLRTFAVVSGVMVTLFLMQAWWVNDTPRHYALLERALPASSALWMRDAISDGVPRFLNMNPVMRFDPIELLEPPKAPRRLAAWVPASDVRTEPARMPAPQAAPVAETPPVRAVEVAPLRFAVPVPVPASAPAAPAPASPVARLTLAQSTVATSPVPAPVSAPNAPSAQDIELLVARVVSYYEQGDASALMSLYASGEPGFFRAMRVRNAYSDFFRATKDRRLRMDRLDWQTAPETARARGEATLIADYTDGSGKLERKVAVELDVAMRDGQARLTRLSLYPETK